MTGFQLVANKFVKSALAGDAEALKEIFDRIGGEATLAPSQPFEKSTPIVAAITKKRLTKATKWNIPSLPNTSHDPNSLLFTSGPHVSPAS